MHQLKLAAVLLCAISAGNAAAQTKPGTGGFLPPASSSANVIDSIYVVVNDEVITRNEVGARVRDITARMKAQNAPLPEAADLERQVVERMIVERAQMQLAKEMGVRVDDAMLDRAIGRIAEQQNMTVQAMRDTMEKEGTKYAVFREEIRGEIMMQRLREHEVDSKIQVSDAEIDTFMAAEKAASADKVQVEIAQILVRIPENSSPEQIAARRARADEVVRQIGAGADYAKMAGTYSDASDALQGGMIGWRSPELLPPIFATELLKLAPGQITPVIKTSAGFYILKLTNKRSAASAGPEKATVQQSRVRHIMVRVTPAMSAADAKKKLGELKAQIDAKSAKFEDLARLHSNDSSATKGGDLGWLSPGDAVPEFEAAVAALKPGEVSGVVESPLGFHLIEVLERKTDDVTGARARDVARNALRERKLQEATEDWARQVRDRAYVEFREER
ncbi:peptidylprolyl isomerase [Massilia glaciei]|nr:peptidylprolyl isomerase [Massilia glaciei]